MNKSNLEGSIRNSEGGPFKVMKRLDVKKHGALTGVFYEIRYLDDGSKSTFEEKYVLQCKELTTEDYKKFQENQNNPSAYEKTKGFTEIKE